MRYLLFALYVSSLITMILMVLSDFFFGHSSGRDLGRRLLLVLVWPIAILSRAGRVILFNNGRDL